MPIHLEFYNLIMPIEAIKRKYPGGWEQFLKDHESCIWYDGHLVRVAGAMNPWDIETYARDFEKMGFQITEKKNGRKV